MATNCGQRETKTNKRLSEEHKRAIAEALKGRSFSEAHARAISEALEGNSNAAVRNGETKCGNRRKTTERPSSSSS